MHAVILCGGKGTRLREYTETIPKPLVEIGGKPIIWHLMKYYAHFGVRDFIICTGYLPDKFTEYFSQPHEFHSVTCINTGVDTLKSQRIKQIQPLIPAGQDFFVAYGDDLSDVPLPELLDFHSHHDTIATLVAVQPKSQYGILQFSGPKVGKFIEKPVLEHWMNGGFFIFKYEIFNHLHYGELEQVVLPKLAETGQVAAYRHSGFWKSMNTFQDALELNELHANNQAAWKIWDNSYEHQFLAK